MLCHVYRSEKKDSTYLYLIEDNTTKDLPENLVVLLGRLEFVMAIDLEKVTQLANADLQEVKNCLIERGFYLQLPRQLYTAE